MSQGMSQGDTSELDRAIDRMLRRSVQHEPCPLDGKELRQYIMQLPLWSEEVRAAPNEILRSALFLPANRKIPRPFLKDKEIASIGEGVTISYTGEQLRQDDEPIWLQLLHLCRGKPLGAPVEFPPAAFIRSVGRSLGRNPSANDYNWLSDSISRFTATVLVVQSHRLKSKVGLSMVRRFAFQDEDGARLAKWRVWIEPEMATLFGGIYYTQVEWQMRLMLPNGIATWLLGFLSSHRKPYPVKIETIMKTISSYDSSTNPRALTEFKKSLIHALHELVKVGFLESFEIRDGLLITKRARW